MSKKVTALFCATGAAMFFAACDDSDEEPDARVPNMFDANTGPTIDGGDVDAGDIDGGPTATYPGTVSVQEIALLNPPLNMLGQGVQVSITFENSLTSIKPVLEEMMGQPTGCKVWEYTPEQAAIPSTDEGAVKLTIAGDNAPVYPPCVHGATGYVCASAGGPAATGAITDENPENPTPANGQWAFTLAGAMFSAAATPGSYLSISGATNAANNGLFPILLRASDNTVVFLNTRPTAGAEVIADVNARFAVVSGIGPNPARPAEPFWVTDTATLDVDIDGNENTHLGDVGLAAPVPFADHFALTTESAALLQNIPLTGAAFTVHVDCGGGTCPAAAGNILNIITTDADVSAIPLPGMPPPKAGGKRVQVRCAQFGNTDSITVPAEFSKFLMESGATRIQATFLRSGIGMINASGSVVNVVAGHGFVGFTNVAPPTKPAK